LLVNDDKAIIIDAGVTTHLVEDHLKLYSKKPKVVGVLLTHCHFDHILNLDDFLSKYSCNAYICKPGKEMLYDKEKNLSYLTDSPFVVKSKRDIKTFVDGDVLQLDGFEIKCFNIPGHSIDSSCFVIDDNMFLGDTVFKVGVGRTDLFSGDENVLKITLKRLLDELSLNINNFYPGHNSNFDKKDMIYNINRTLGDI